MEIEILSVFPASAQKAIALLNDPETDLYDIQELIDSEPAYTGAVLRVANSPICRGAHEITSTSQAIVRLGWAMIGNIILSLSMRRNLPDSPKAIATWRATLLTASWAMHICKAHPDLKTQADTGFTAGLLSGIGEIIGAIPSYEKKYRNCKDMEKLTVNILEHWHLPDLLIDSARIGRNLFHVQEQVQIRTIPDVVAVSAVFAGRRSVTEDFASLLEDWRHLDNSVRQFFFQLSGSPE